MSQSPSKVNTLVILAAGRGSRFGGAKQFAQFGRYQKTLMEYNIAHALAHGFNHLVFITQARHGDLLAQQVITHLPKQVSCDIVYQDNQQLPKGCFINKERTKPLGTAHALWCAREVIPESFVVINADDYYGEQAFRHIKQLEAIESAYLVAYLIPKTLSTHGGVNRGLCQLCDDNMLRAIAEIENIHYQSNGQLIGFNQQQQAVTLAKDALVSMNFWCFNQAIFPTIEQLLQQTFTATCSQTLECYLPDAVMRFIEQSHRVKVLTSHDSWFGVTYAADSDLVDSALSRLIDKGLFSSLSS